MLAVMLPGVATAAGGAGELPKSGTNVNDIAALQRGAGKKRLLVGPERPLGKRGDRGGGKRQRLLRRLQPLRKVPLEEVRSELAGAEGGRVAHEARQLFFGVGPGVLEQLLEGLRGKRVTRDIQAAPQGGRRCRSLSGICGPS